MIVRKSRLLLLLSLSLCGTASAQNYSGDARRIGMGGIGDSGSLAPGMTGKKRPYHSIGVPLALIQLYQDRERFDPAHDSFNPLLVLEYAANPLHYVFGRAPAGNIGRFVSDVVNGTVNRDLNAYRGSAPVNEFLAAGLVSPNWGKTFKIIQRKDGSFHGFYAGIGPYLSAGTDLNIDRQLTEVFASATPVLIANRTFTNTNVSNAQVALAVSGGYRGRIPWPGRRIASKAGRDGIYLGANYSYLRGFLYQNADMHIRLDTDANGLLTILPAVNPVVIDLLDSRSGSGFAIDLGLAAVMDRWEFGFGVTGIANRIEWREPVLKRYSLLSLVAGMDLISQNLPAPASKVRVELPVNYTGSGAFHLDDWTIVTEMSHGFQKISFHCGFERRLGILDLRGGGRYSLDRWSPTGGIGLNLGRHFSLDVAAFGISTNIERQMRPALALSLRLNRLQ
jgi:hypothetical protein